MWWYGDGIVTRLVCFGLTHWLNIYMYAISLTTCIHIYRLCCEGYFEVSAKTKSGMKQGRRRIVCIPLYPSLIPLFNHMCTVVIAVAVAWQLSIAWRRVAWQRATLTRQLRSPFDAHLYSQSMRMTRTIPWWVLSWWEGGGRGRKEGREGKGGVTEWPRQHSATILLLISYFCLSHFSRLKNLNPRGPNGKGNHKLRLDNGT